MTNPKIKLKAEDFGKWDNSDVYSAGAQLLGTVADIAYHKTNPGEGWQPFAKVGDMPALVTEVRGHLERLEEATKSARREIARVESTARLAAIRRQKQEGRR